MKATVDYHGFKQTLDLQRLDKVIAVAGRSRLRERGVSEFATLEGNEDGLTIFSLRFALRDRARRRYECAGCSLCDPRALRDVLCRLAETAAEVAIRKWNTVERRERRIARTVERVLAQRRRRR